MRLAVAFVVALALVACMKKQADGTYRVTNPITTDTAKAHDNAAKSGDELRQKARSLGRAAEKGLGKVAQTAGAKLQQVGKKAEADAKKTH